MNRRDFIKTTGLSAAACCAGDFLKWSSDAKPLGIQLWTVRDQMAAHPEATLERLASMGFTHVELFGYDGNLFGLKPLEFWWILKNTGLKAISSHHNTGRIAGGAGTLKTDWNRTVDELASIGVQYAVCAWLDPQERSEEHYRELPDLLEKSSEIARKSGLRFGYHNHDFEFEPMADGLKYDFLLRNTAPANVFMELDLYWLTKTGQDPLQYFDQYPGRFPLWHVKDLTASGEFAALGEGTIDFRKIFASRKKAGLEHWFVEQDESQADIFDSLTLSRNYVRKNGF